MYKFKKIVGIADGRNDLGYKLRALGDILTKRSIILPPPSQKIPIFMEKDTSQYIGEAYVKMEDNGVINSIMFIYDDKLIVNGLYPRIGGTLVGREFDGEIFLKVTAISLSQKENTDDRIGPIKLL